MAMAPGNYSNFDYDRMGGDAFLEFDSARAKLEMKQRLLDQQMQQMQQMLQQQAYPMYQTQGGMTNPYAPSSTGTWTSVTTATTAPRSRYRPCNYCGRPVEEGAYCVCRGPGSIRPDRDYSLPTDYPTTSTRPVCKSCGEKCGARNILKGQDCDRTRGRKKQKQIRNFRKLYWHRRFKNPELFENKTVT